MFVIGQRVEWVSAAGKFQGEITKIRTGLNAANRVIHWMMIKVKGRKNHVMLPMTNDYCAMMKVRVI